MWFILCVVLLQVRCQSQPSWHKHSPSNMATSSDAPHQHPASVRVMQVSSASQVLSTPGSRQLAVCCHAAKATLSAAFLHIVHNNQGMPLLSSKSSDGTPMNTVQRQKVKTPEGQTVACSGRATAEFLCQLQFVRALHADGTHETSVLLAEAQRLGTCGSGQVHR